MASWAFCWPGALESCRYNPFGAWSSALQCHICLARSRHVAVGSMSPTALVQWLMHAVAAGLQGYHANDAATAGAFRAGEGWFDTGDLGWIAPREHLGHNSSPLVHVTAVQL